MAKAAKKPTVVPRKRPHEAAFKQAIKRLRNLSQAEKIQRFKDIGILDQKGNLAPKYSQS